MNNAVEQPITYGRLSEILIRLGFSRRDTTEYVAFKNPDYNALIALPVTRPQDPVRPAHLLAAQSTVTASGVASESTFQRLLHNGAKEDTRNAPITAPPQSEAV